MSSHFTKIESADVSSTVKFGATIGAVKTRNHLLKGGAPAAFEVADFRDA